MLGWNEGVGGGNYSDIYDKKVVSVTQSVEVVVLSNNSLFHNNYKALNTETNKYNTTE